MTHHSGVSSHDDIYVPLFVWQSKGFNPREEDVGWILAIHNAVNEQGELLNQMSCWKHYAPEITGHL